MTTVYLHMGGRRQKKEKENEFTEPAQFSGLK